jgi:hypothetical protein
MARPLSVAVLLLVLAVPCVVLGQAYEGTSHLLVAGGVTVPFGGIGDFFNAGPEGRLTIRFPVSQMVSLGLQGGITGPRASDDDSELMQVPVKAVFYFPIAPEASGTPYVAVGAGATFNIFGCKENRSPCYKDTTETYFTYSVTLGYTMRPEAYTSVFFDFAVRYEQQLINDYTDYKSMEVEAGIGLCF